MILLFDRFALEVLLKIISRTLEGEYYACELVVAMNDGRGNVAIMRTTRGAVIMLMTSRSFQVLKIFWRENYPNWILSCVHYKKVVI